MYALKRSVLIAGLVFAAGCGYNTIQTYDEQVNAAASQIKVQLQRRGVHLLVIRLNRVVEIGRAHV